MITSLGKEIGNRMSDGLKNTARAEIIAITSGKGGVGKSSISVNFAMMLQQMRKKVLMIDADIHLGNVDLLMGIRAPHTLADLFDENMQLKDIIAKGPGNIDILYLLKRLQCQYR